MEFGNVMLFVDCFLIVMMLDLELIFFDLRKAYLFIRVSGVGMKFGWIDILNVRISEFVIFSVSTFSFYLNFLSS